MTHNELLKSSPHPTAQKQPGPRWLYPQTLGRTVALFTAAYLLIQPLIAGIILPLFYTPAFKTWEEWRTFLLVLIPLGATAGILWWLNNQVRRRWLRCWLRGTVRGLAMIVILSAKDLPETFPMLWVLRVVLAAVLFGGLLGWMERWDVELESSPSESEPAHKVGKS